MARSIDVFVVAPALLCWGFEKLARSAGTRVRVAGSAAHLAEAAESLRRVRADVLVVDVEVTQGEPLRSVGTQHPVVLLVGEREAADADSWKEAGAQAVIPKSHPPALLMRAIHAAWEAQEPRQRIEVAPIEVRCAPGAQGEPDQLKISSLTARERQLVFAVICNSTCSGKVLASRLCISEHTLRNHLSSIYGKLGVQNRLSLHDFAVRHHLESDARLLRP